MPGTESAAGFLSAGERGQEFRRSDPGRAFSRQGRVGKGLDRRIYLVIAGGPPGIDSPSTGGHTVSGWAERWRHSRFPLRGKAHSGPLWPGRFGPLPCFCSGGQALVPISPYGKPPFGPHFQVRDALSGTLPPGPGSTLVSLGPRAHSESSLAWEETRWSFQAPITLIVTWATGWL